MTRIVEWFAAKAAVTQLSSSYQAIGYLFGVYVLRCCRRFATELRLVRGSSMQGLSASQRDFNNFNSCPPRVLPLQILDLDHGVTVTTIMLDCSIALSRSTQTGYSQRGIPEIIGRLCSRQPFDKGGQVTYSSACSDASFHQLLLIFLVAVGLFRCQALALVEAYAIDILKTSQ